MIQKLFHIKELLKREKIFSDNTSTFQPVTVTDIVAACSPPSAIPIKQLQRPSSECTAAEISTPHSPNDSPLP